MNITAFMNLMVVLVPFLLITAVFSRLTILQLNLPGEADPSVPVEQELKIEVIVRKDRIEVAERTSGLLKALPSTNGAYDIKGLNDYLQVIKTKYPEKTDSTLLLEPDTQYDVVVQMMDAMRAVTVQQGGRISQAELFPDISVGDAPETGPLPNPVPLPKPAAGATP
jgi:biopolymer transport protein ExbD